MTVPATCNLSKGFQIEQQDMEKDVVQGFGDFKETHHIPSWKAVTKEFVLSACSSKHGTPTRRRRARSGATSGRSSGAVAY
jgi:hypothetical protein